MQLPRGMVTLAPPSRGPVSRPDCGHRLSRQRPWKPSLHVGLGCRPCHHSAAGTPPPCCVVYGQLGSWEEGKHPCWEQPLTQRPAARGSPTVLACVQVLLECTHLLGVPQSPPGSAEVRSHSSAAGGAPLAPHLEEVPRFNLLLAFWPSPGELDPPQCLWCPERDRDRRDGIHRWPRSQGRQFWVLGRTHRLKPPLGARPTSPHPLADDSPDVLGGSEGFHVAGLLSEAARAFSLPPPPKHLLELL